MQVIDEPLPRTGGVYMIVNLWTRITYVGSSSNMRLRSFSHKAHLRTGTHSNDKLQAAWNEYGEPAFAFILVAEIADQCLRIAAERAHIARLMPACYNHSVCGPRSDKIDPSIATAQALLPRRVTKNIAKTS